MFLCSVETLTAFLASLRSMAETPSVIERQKTVRLRAKDRKQDEQCCAYNTELTAWVERLSFERPFWMPQTSRSA